MKRIIVLISLLCIFSMQLSAQTEGWSEPYLIATDTATLTYADFCFDTEGAMHMIWTHYFFTNTPSVIYYKISLDNGITWSLPKNISKNDSGSYTNPLIATDYENNIHITCEKYKPECSYTPYYITATSAGQWANPVQLEAEGFGQNHTLVIDKNNKIYAFFGTPNNKIAYKTLYNNEWSEAIFPYGENAEPNSEYYSISDVKVDNNNNLVCVGLHADGNFPQIFRKTIRTILFTYNLNADTWSDYQILGNTTSYGEPTLSFTHKNTENADSIYIARGEIIHDSTGAAQGLESHVSLITNGNHIDNQRLTFTPRNQQTHYHQAIAVDSYNQMHLVQNEKINGRYYHMHYRKINNQWVGQHISSSLIHGFYYNKLISHNGSLYLLYSDGLGAIKLRTWEENEFDGINEEQMRSLSQCQILPNPVASTCQFSYHLAAASLVNIQLYNSHGQAVCTIYQGQQAAGQQQIEWDAQGLSAGIYFVRLQAGKYVINAKLVKE